MPCTFKVPSTFLLQASHTPGLHVLFCFSCFFKPVPCRGAKVKVLILQVSCCKPPVHGTLSELLMLACQALPDLALELHWHPLMGSRGAPLSPSIKYREGSVNRSQVLDHIAQQPLSPGKDLRLDPHKCFFLTFCLLIQLLLLSS